MTMEQPSTHNLYDLFNGRIQFQVPVYQRAYVWNAEENWEVLWDDIADTVDRFLAEPEANQTQRHFLGPIVLSQEHSDAGAVDRRLVIDGQQRLTTLQILIASASASARSVDEGIADELEGLTENRGRAATGDWRYKVWPSRRDQAAFKATLENGGDEGVDDGLPGAWRFFHNRIADWIDADGEAEASDRLKRLEALQVCLEELLYVVSINLDDSDNAQVIFETLNARGTGLGALDLVKNAIFLQAEREDAPAAALNDELWEPTFESDSYWLEEVRQGREKRARSDWFLMHWLALEVGEVVRSDKLFDRFRKDLLHPGSVAMQELVPRLCADARTLRSFDLCEPGSPEGLFFSRLETMDTTTMLPVALFLFRTESLDHGRRLRALRALESWLVRRAVLRLTSKNYNRTLASLVKAIKAEADKADEAIVRELRGSQAQTAIWPSDAEIKERLEGGDLYGYVGQPRVRMLLEACELDMRDSPKTEDVGLPAGLSIEHAMPRKWQQNWSVDDVADPEAAAEERAQHINRLGNLTLVTKPLNSSLSAAPWLGSDQKRGKRAELMKRSVLLINQTLCEHETWNEELIDRRSSDLTSRIIRVWPGPDDALWTAAGAASF